METASGGDKPNNAFRPSLRFAKAVWEDTETIFTQKRHKMQPLNLHPPQTRFCQYFLRRKALLSGNL